MRIIPRPSTVVPSSNPLNDDAPVSGSVVATGAGRGAPVVGGTVDGVAWPGGSTPKVGVVVVVVAVVAVVAGVVGGDDSASVVVVVPGSVVVVAGVVVAGVLVVEVVDVVSGTVLVLVVVVVSGTVVEDVVSGTVVVEVVGTTTTARFLQNPASVAGTPISAATSITSSAMTVPSPKTNRPAVLSTQTYVIGRLETCTESTGVANGSVYDSYVPAGQPLPGTAAEAKNGIAAKLATMVVAPMSWSRLARVVVIRRHVAPAGTCTRVPPP
jgi:hypothetical protein